MTDFVLQTQGVKWGEPTYGTTAGLVPWSFWEGNLGGEGFPFNATFSAAMQEETRRALDRWEAIADIDFIEVADGTFPRDRGLRLGLGQIDGPLNTLALAHRSNYSDNSTMAAELIVDTAEGWHFENGRLVDFGGVLFYVVVLHEIGHTLGLAHYDAGPAVMNSVASTGIADLLAADIHGGQFIYGIPTTSFAGTLARNEIFRFETLARALTIVGNAGTDLIWGGQLADTLKGGADRDVIIGDNGNDVIYGDDNATDTIGSADQLLGGGDDDTLYGGGGNDYINGEWGNDLAFGGFGNDLVYGGFGSDVIFGGDGNDELWGATSLAPNGAWFGAPIDISWNGTTNQTIATESWTIAGEEQSSDTSDDRIFGEAGADRIFGNAGNDTLAGDGAVLMTEHAQSINRLYLATLARSADDGGLAAWTAQYDAGTALATIATGFVNSAEFQIKYGALDSTQFVTLLYNNVLHRAPDSGGLAGWVGSLTGGASRESVVTGFSESTEFVVASDPTVHAGQVYRLYGATLARQPDAGGFAGWVATLDNGAGVTDTAAGFVGSVEFQATYGALSNTAFVTLL
jgi:hypothetical protein